MDDTLWRGGVDFGTDGALGSGSGAILASRYSCGARQGRADHVAVYVLPAMRMSMGYVVRAE